MIYETDNKQKFSLMLKKFGINIILSEFLNKYQRPINKEKYNNVTSYISSDCIEEKYIKMEYY